MSDPSPHDRAPIAEAAPLFLAVAVAVVVLVALTLLYGIEGLTMGMVAMTFVTLALILVVTTRP